MIGDQAVVLTPLAVVAGSGWYPTEIYAGTKFRWAKSGAELIVAAVQPVKHSLILMIEPGPGVSLKPFDLTVKDDGVEIETVRVRGKERIRIDLPPSRPRLFHLNLTTEAGGKSSHNDPRIMDFRAFEIGLHFGKLDVLPAYVKLGSGWYPLETHADSTFRWVSNDAEISVANSDGRFQLLLDIEPSAGLGGKPLALGVLRKVGDDTNKLAEFRLNCRTTIHVPIPAAERVDLVLHADDLPERKPGETRTLTFRAFQYGGG